MRKTIYWGIGGILMTLFLCIVISQPALAYDKRVAENPLLRYNGNARPTVVEDINCNVGYVYNRITNTTVESRTGTNDWTILMGDDAQIFPSMRRQTPAQYAAVNDYLYFGSLRIGKGDKLVKFSSDTSPGITVKSNATDTTAISLLDTYFKISDQSSNVADADKINVEVHSTTHAWSESYRRNFIIYDYWILNLNSTQLDSLYVGLHADCDISVPEGGSGVQAYSIDDLVDYVKDDATGEYISYMYDGDSPNVPGDDLGGNKIPKECSGFIGSRLLYCPPVAGSTTPSVQSGHAWWDWNSDPGTDADWMRILTDGQWLPRPPSVHDYRFFQKLGPFNIPANDSIRCLYAFGIGEGLAGLRADLGWADSLFKHNWIGPSAPTQPGFTLTPGDRQVEITWDTVAETTPDQATGQIDFEGYRVWRSTGAAGNWTLLMECDLVDDLGHNTGLVHSYLDNDVNNGFQYRYVVTAYDKGDPANNIESFESGKGNFETAEPGRLVYTPNFAKTGIHVAPNPFVLSSPLGYGFTPNPTNPSQERISFVNLPKDAEATVTIYTLTGDEIIKLTKLFNETRVDWDLITKKTQKIVAGVYLYVVESPALSKNHIDKFMIVR